MNRMDVLKQLGFSEELISHVENWNLNLEVTPEPDGITFFSVDALQTESLSSPIIINGTNESSCGEIFIHPLI